MSSESSGIDPIMWENLVADAGAHSNQRGQIVLGSPGPLAKTMAAEGRTGWGLLPSQQLWFCFR